MKNKIFISFDKLLSVSPYFSNTILNSFILLNLSSDGQIKRNVRSSTGFVTERPSLASRPSHIVDFSTPREEQRQGARAVRTRLRRATTSMREHHRWISRWRSDTESMTFLRPRVPRSESFYPARNVRPRRAIACDRLAHVIYRGKERRAEFYDQMADTSIAIFSR